MPAALRAAGLKVHTMADVYGERVGQGLDDEEWLRDAGTRGWVVVMKDAKIRYRPSEREALISHNVRAFCVMNANLRAAEQASRIVTNIERILTLSEQPGPFMYGIYSDGVRALWRA